MNLDIRNQLENTTMIATLIVVMFFLSGINKVMTFDSLLSNLQGKLTLNVPVQFYTIIGLIVICIEIISPIIIINHALTNRYKQEAYYSVLALVIFTILATFMYHFPDLQNYKKSIPFWANVSLIGGLLLLAKNIKNN